MSKLLSLPYVHRVDHQEVDPAFHTLWSTAIIAAVRARGPVPPRRCRERRTAGRSAYIDLVPAPKLSMESSRELDLIEKTAFVRRSGRAPILIPWRAMTRHLKGTHPSSRARTKKTKTSSKQKARRADQPTSSLTHRDKGLPLSKDSVAANSTVTEDEASTNKIPSSGLLARYPHSISVRLHADLYREVRESLAKADFVQDFRFITVPDVVRAALREYFDTRVLNAPVEAGPRIRTTVGLDDALKLRWEKLPRGKHSAVLERAVRTFLRKGRLNIIAQSARDST